MVVDILDFSNIYAGVAFVACSAYPWREVIPGARHGGGGRCSWGTDL